MEGNFPLPRPNSPQRTRRTQRVDGFHDRFPIAHRGHRAGWYPSPHNKRTDLRAQSVEGRKSSQLSGAKPGMDDAASGKCTGPLPQIPRAVPSGSRSQIPARTLFATLRLRVRSQYQPEVNQGSRRGNAERDARDPRECHAGRVPVRVRVRVLPTGRSEWREVRSRWRDVPDDPGFAHPLRDFASPREVTVPAGGESGPSSR